MTSTTRVSFRAFSNATSGSTRAALATCLAPTTCTDRKRSVAPSRATKQQNTLQGFADTLRSNLSAPDPSNFEPDALLKELKETAHLGKRGEVFVLGQFALILLVVFPPLDLHLPLQLLGFLGMGLGGSIIIAGSNSLGKSLTPLPAPRRDAVLVTDGMFAYIRHPLYAGAQHQLTETFTHTTDSTQHQAHAMHQQVFSAMAPGTLLNALSTKLQIMLGICKFTMGLCTAI